MISRLCLSATRNQSHMKSCTVCLQHPGFDFSNARFEGEVPDAQTFMGGISRS